MVTLNVIKVHFLDFMLGRDTVKDGRTRIYEIRFLGFPIQRSRIQ